MIKLYLGKMNAKISIPCEYSLSDGKWKENLLHCHYLLKNSNLHFNFKLTGINHGTLFLKYKTWGGDLFIKKSSCCVS